ncbi:MAG: D-sedoheptulose 7-phosphate isomerase [Bryobacterales bacterium]|nr:D-sedoheptulose 7-phosphate isomerase [Bryobacterales bacterium]
MDPSSIGKAADFLAELFSSGHTLYVCGNGGSAAISNHLLCDFSKGIQTGTVLRPRVVSLSSHVELITAIGNDMDFADIFAYQLRTAARDGDALMTISSSGNSENIVRAIQWASGHNVQSIALTGFEGGRSAKLADINIHVPASNYGVVEDVHQSVMHILAQFIRMRLMDPALIADSLF